MLDGQNGCALLIVDVNADQRPAVLFVHGETLQEEADFEEARYREAMLRTENAVTGFVDMTMAQDIVSEHHPGVVQERLRPRGILDYVRIREHGYRRRHPTSIVLTVAGLADEHRELPA
jgi:hypothetical protein